MANLRAERKLNARFSPVTKRIKGSIDKIAEA
jgi:hypothetical protein